ncbi:hypothetical protein [Nonomuraea endophytica]|uniref:Uncharacterized protein n=1 Tax=Nonomuraea endophytica TaxID=714136 RepID=A0A7W8A8X2_9ACTN|nr:hypothetical protein [Nonomuraea endophytica]MBB5081797.1 hypothetical protein [Nonomuraea endophytica]
MPEKFTNVAKDNAHVNAQIGKAFGGVTIGTAHSRRKDLGGHLAELRSAIKSGTLTPSIHAEVEAELAKVDTWLIDQDKERFTGMLMALKKAKGLLGDVAPLSSIATLALAAAEGLRS